MLKGLFWVSVFGVLFSYLLYPFLLRFSPRRPGVKEKHFVSTVPPRVSLIVTAHNEEARIREKLENCLKLDFPGLEIIVASDASTDETDQIVAEYSNRGVRLARAEERKGKEHAQLQAIKASTGEILIFSDVATSIPEDAIDRMVRYFDDPVVGAVSSEDRFVSRDGTVAGEGAYVRYEMWLRGVESDRAGLVGLSGSFFAARREVCEEDWDIYSPSDFNTALNSARKGLVAVTAPDVLGYYHDVADASKEYQRKIRTIIRGLTALSRHAEVLNPFRFGWFSFQVFGHKLMRWAVPWFQILLFVTSVLLAGKGTIYSLALLAQLLFYGVVIAGHYKPELRERTVFKIPYFFVQVNLAIARATVEFFKGRRMTVWTPSKR
ncbi:glycosyltransferase family 2 protein [Marinobacter salarius]|jgi:cellulose synthase/poly-beta-1,6-N-acetylglucosamine synthase-like glycosyltransferase|uniref:glycosyltransferase family 2 protein n=1 Tax=Marinobacter salarius TaxID=1420917 RepID=UPI0018F21971|nr:glycosyltransferase family 2 protein [Marinobacter salarius]MBJ7277696.1 glycosyltransferase family 2 protein [Marinobacter salarius]